MAVRQGAPEVSGNSWTGLRVFRHSGHDVTPPSPADVVIVGGGLVGLACAAALARDGASAILLDDRQPGAASGAAAGMLAPSLDRERGSAYDFAVAARDGYPAFIDWLQSATGIRVPLNTAGVLQVAVSEAGVRGLKRAMVRDADPSAEWLDAHAVRDLEPALSHAFGAVFHPRDGAVDNVALLAALTAYCRSAPGVAFIEAAAIEVRTDASGISVRTSDGRVCRGAQGVIAAGAWAPAIVGLPLPLPVSPLRGQMLAFASCPVRHVIFGPRGYLVPRFDPDDGSRSSDETLVGATSEQAGFDATTTPAAGASLLAAGIEILPSLRHSSPARHWAGLRPVTPDLLPIIGPDPHHPRLLYACGHSRNGVLMAPLTGDCISAIVRGSPSLHDLRAFSIERFARG